MIPVLCATQHWPGQTPLARPPVPEYRRWVSGIAVVLGFVLTASPLHADVFLRANQVDFKARDPKVAVAFSSSALPDRFSVIDVSSGATVFEGDLRGQEGVVFARTFWHSIVLTLALGVLVAIQQFVVPGIIPH